MSTRAQGTQRREHDVNCTSNSNQQLDLVSPAAKVLPPSTCYPAGSPTQHCERLGPGDPAEMAPSQVLQYKRIGEAALQRDGPKYRGNPVSQLFFPEMPGE